MRGYLFTIYLHFENANVLSDLLDMTSKCGKIKLFSLANINSCLLFYRILTKLNIFKHLQIHDPISKSRQYLSMHWLQFTIQITRFIYLNNKFQRFILNKFCKVTKLNFKLVEKHQIFCRVFVKSM